jgi:hypothetical protein
MTINELTKIQHKQRIETLMNLTPPKAENVVMSIIE